MNPNDLGLFDMHGNVWNWCQDRYLPYPENKRDEAVADKEDDVLTIDVSSSRVLRGGSFVDDASNVRSACRGVNRPDHDNAAFGVRPARTFR